MFEPYGAMVVGAIRGGALDQTAVEVLHFNLVDLIRLVSPDC